MRALSTIDLLKNMGKWAPYGTIICDRNSDCKLCSRGKVAGVQRCSALKSQLSELHLGSWSAPAMDVAGEKAKKKKQMSWFLWGEPG